MIRVMEMMGMMRGAGDGFRLSGRTEWSAFEGQDGRKEALSYHRRGAENGSW